MAPLYGFTAKLPTALLELIRTREHAIRQGLFRVPIIETPSPRD